MKSNIKWILFFGWVCIVCLTIWLYRINSVPEYKTARIIKNGEVIEEINLLNIDKTYEFEIADESGRNIVRAQQGKIAVIDADCPDKICVNQGYIDNSAVPIVCLPHRLSIEIIGGNNEIDAVAGGN